jgi:hypothetical protein
MIRCVWTKAEYVAEHIIVDARVLKDANSADTRGWNRQATEVNLALMASQVSLARRAALSTSVGASYEMYI